jgi:hypothetical protein
MNCNACKYHSTLYTLAQGEYLPTHLFRCKSHLQKATYTNRVLSIFHPMTKKCRYHSDLEVHDDQIKIEVI